MRRCLALNMREYLIFSYQYLIRRPLSYNVLNCFASDIFTINNFFYKRSNTFDLDAA